MLNILKKLFQSTPNNKPAEPAATTEYDGFQITPIPNQGDGGWSCEATIEKEIDSELKTHHFIRADKSPTREAAIDLTLSKCRIAIDQMGKGIFS